MRLLKKPIKQEVSQETKKPVKKRPPINKDAGFEKSKKLFGITPEKQQQYIKYDGIYGVKGKPEYKDYKTQSVDGFVARVKMCIGKPDLTDGSKRIFGSKVQGVFYDVYANVCKTPTSGVVVGVKIVDPVYHAEYLIDGAKFEKEEGLLDYFKWCRDRQMLDGITGDGVTDVPKSRKT